MNNIQYKIQIYNGIQVSSKKTIRRKRRFLKRKSAKTYRRSRKGIMRGGNETWKVKVNYAEYTHGQTFDDIDGAVDKKEGDRTFEISLKSPAGYSGILTLDDKKTNFGAWNNTEFKPDNPVYIRNDTGPTFFSSSLKPGDKQIISFERIE